MSYLGSVPAVNYKSIQKQTITGNGGTSYTLSYPVGNEQEIEVFVNNVRQEPGVAYTTSGTNLTMTGTVASTDTFYVVFQGKAEQTIGIPEKQNNGNYSFDSGTLFIDSVNNEIGIGTTNPTSNLHVIGTANVTSNLAVGGTTLSINGNNITPFNFRNKIINGNMVIDQRNSGNSTYLTTANNVYTVDRWWGQVAANTTNCTITRATDGPAGYLNSLKVQRTSGNTGTSAITTGQIIESFNCYDLQSQNITLSFWAKAGANLSNSTLNITVKSGTTADEGMTKYANNTWTGTSSVISTSQVISNTWTKYTFTTASALGSSIAELGVSFSYTPVGTAGANDWFEITGVQLESGSIATPFELRSIGTETNLCERYYVRGSTVYYYYGGQYSSVAYPSVMRSIPTLTFTLNPSGGSTAGTTGFFVFHSATTVFGYTASAEL